MRTYHNSSCTLKLSYIVYRKYYNKEFVIDKIIYLLSLYSNRLPLIKWKRSIALSNAEMIHTPAWFYNEFVCLMQSDGNLHMCRYKIKMNNRTYTIYTMSGCSCCVFTSHMHTRVHALNSTWWHSVSYCYCYCCCCFLCAI